MGAASGGPFTAAVVTGAGSGLGQALVLELAERGVDVVAADIDGDRLAETKDRAEAAGLLGTVHPWVCDVRDREQIVELADGSEELLGPVDLLVNNAGIGIGGRDVGQWQDRDWVQALDVNLLGVVHGCEVFLPRMRAHRRGYVINVASAAGLIGPAGMAPYNVSKAAVVALTETTVQELAGSGVEVSVLCPGFFPTRVVEDGVREGRIDPAEARTARALMDFSRHQASDIARIALDGAERGTLYIIPHQEVRLLWLLKRLMPTTYVRTLVPLTWGRARQMAARSAAAAERST